MCPLTSVATLLKRKRTRGRMTVLRQQHQGHRRPVLKPLTQTYCSLLIRLLIALLLPAELVYADDEAPIAVTVNDPYVNVHTGPGRGYPVFHVIEKGERIELLKKRTEWIKINTYRGRTGWVFREDLRNTVGDNGSAFELTDYSIEGYKNRRWEAGFSLGDFGGADMIGIELGYRFTQNLTAEARFSQIVGNFPTVRSPHSILPTNPSQRGACHLILCWERVK